MDADTADDQFTRRLRFYGAGDFATYWQIHRAAEVVEGFDPAAPPDEVNGILELHNARLFVEAGFIPTDIVEDDRKALVAAAKRIRRTVAQWFDALASRFHVAGWCAACNARKCLSCSGNLGLRSHKSSSGKALRR